MMQRREMAEKDYDKPKSTQTRPSTRNKKRTSGNATKDHIRNDLGIKELEESLKNEEAKQRQIEHTPRQVG